MRVTEKHYSKCSVFAFGFEIRIKTILPPVDQSLDQWSSAGCWPRINHIMLLQLIDVPHWFLINMFLRVGLNWCFQALVQWCDFHAARGESEWCILLWRHAARTVAARHLSNCWRLLLSSVRKSTELLRHKTPDFTPDVAFQQTRPQFCRLRITESHSGMCLSETARDVKHRWWAVVINRMILLTEWHYISQGRVETPIGIGGQLCYISVANLLQ